VANGNSDPTLSTVSDRTIPRDTPFVLDNTSAMDADVGDTLSYQWDQIDTGTLTSAATFGQDLGDNPLFRSYQPQAASSRDFPALGTQLQGMYDEAEVMACSSRNLNFRLTVRDGSSGQATDDVRVTVNRNAGPFAVTAFNSAQTLTLANAPFTLTWDVANTGSGSPVNCADVDIDLLTFDDDSYTNYSVHSILAATTNDGTQPITITPLTDSHPRARIRVKCRDNVFYDISDGNLNLVGSSPSMMFSDADNATFFNSNGTTLVGSPPACAVPRPVSAGRNTLTEAGLVNIFVSGNSGLRTAARGCIPGATSGSGNGDASSFGYIWLLLLGGLAVLRRVWRRQG
jgi:hypothetical protein